MYANDDDTEAFLRASGRARRFRRGIIPRSRVGKIASGTGAVVVLAAGLAAAAAAVRYVHSAELFQIPSSSSIELDGNTHLTRPQLLSVFGEDVERNLFRVPLAERRTELEAMPWVEHATVMRLLPNRIRVHVTERTPIAFVRQGGAIGMADASGVLLDIPPDAPGNPHYAFPVVTGLKADDPLPARASRMHLYRAFLQSLDADGKNASAQLSEIDLSDPEDVKALVPDNGKEFLVHFGTEHFLARYEAFEAHIAEWQQQYPHLSGVDMRYERQVVLQMPPKDSTVQGQPVAAAAPASAVPPKAAQRTASGKAEPAGAAHGAATATAARVPKQAVGLPAKDLATQRRVAAIRAWMEKRKALRGEQRSR